MSENLTGVKATGTSPVSDNQPESSATTENIDYGMGPESSSSAQQPTGEGGELDDKKFFEMHGERMFRHPRVKEALEWKKKYDTVQPLAQLAESSGGVENIVELNRYFGPVFNHLLQSPKGNEMWSKLVPILTKVLQDEDFTVAEAKEAIEDELDGEDDRYKTLEDKYNQLESKLTQDEQRKLEERRQNNFQTYLNMVDERLAKEGIPGNLKKWAVKFMSHDLLRYMPKDRNGNPVHPLNQVNEEAFDKCWKDSVLASLKDYEGYYKEKVIKKTEDPGIPDTHESGEAPSPRQPVGHSRSDKAKAMRAFFQKKGSI